ncbi:MAG: hypothetical protein OHK0017_13580 [Patescibacteria group bacterium]
MTNIEHEIMEFKHVSFGYADDKMILKDVCLRLVQGKTYALVGPTGGGKSTTAGLMARLYDPNQGLVEFHDRDIRMYQPEELATKIGFILQEPFLFTGTVGENIRYGNQALDNVSNAELVELLEKDELSGLVRVFENGLDTQINNNSENISLGQKQLIAFMRVILRKPDLLIMDEATANIDTVTEQLLNDIINKLPSTTTKVIIAHRLNTIKNADEILFINGGRIQEAVDFDEALDLIENSRKSS